MLAAFGLTEGQVRTLLRISRREGAWSLPDNVTEDSFRGQAIIARASDDLAALYLLGLVDDFYHITEAGLNKAKTCEVFVQQSIVRSGKR